MNSNKKVKIQLKKKFDNVIQYLRKKFLSEFKNIKAFDNKNCNEFPSKKNSNSTIDLIGESNKQKVNFNNVIKIQDSGFGQLNQKEIIE